MPVLHLWCVPQLSMFVSITGMLQHLLRVCLLLDSALIQDRCMQKHLEAAERS